MSDIVTRARELLAGITPGPWTFNLSHGTRNVYSVTSPDVYAAVAQNIWGPETAELIAAAPQLVADLADRIESAESLLRALVDADDCWFDHNGDCQAHGFFDGPCAHEQAKQFLGMKEADRG